ncbi:MAG: hypothetical protein U1E52_07135 [Geminicoccaceae bacterium]
MTTHHEGIGGPWRLTDVTRPDRARFVKEARRLRNQQIDRLLRSAGHGLARLWPVPRRATPLSGSPAR